MTAIANTSTEERLTAMADPVNVTVSLHVKTCAHGHIYAVPYWVSDGYFLCPLCAKRIHSDLVNQSTTLHQENQRLGRSISSLRGALTKARKRNG